MLLWTLQSCINRKKLHGRCFITVWWYINWEYFSLGEDNEVSDYPRDFQDIDIKEEPLEYNNVSYDCWCNFSVLYLVSSWFNFSLTCLQFFFHKKYYSNVIYHQFWYLLIISFWVKRREALSSVIYETWKIFVPTLFNRK